MKARQILFLCIVLSLLGAPARGAEKAYTFGLGGLDTSSGAQFKTMFEDLFRAFNEKYGVRVKTIYFLDQPSFEKSVAGGDLDFFASANMDTLWRLFEDPSFGPFLAMGAFGTDRDQMCLFVNKGGETGGVKRFKGTDVLMQSNAFDYFTLRRLTGTRPEEFFKSLRIRPNAISVVYSLAMSDADAVYTGVGVVEMLRRSNPGPVKNFHAVACSDQYILSALFYRKKTVADVDMERVRNFLVALLSEPSLKKYRPLVKQFQIRFIPVTGKDYEPVVALYKEAAKKGWDKDYERWVKLVKPSNDAAPGTEKMKP